MANSDKNLAVSDGRDVFQLLFLVACVLVGSLGFLKPELSSPNLVHAFGPLLTWWNLGIATGALTTSVGIAMRLSAKSLVIQRIGMVLLAGLCTAYGITVLDSHDPSLTGGLMVTVSFGFSSAVRAWQITRDLRKLNRFLCTLGSEYDVRNGGGDDEHR